MDSSKKRPDSLPESSGLNPIKPQRPPHRPYAVPTPSQSTSLSPPRVSTSKSSSLPGSSSDDPVPEPRVRPQQSPPGLGGFYFTLATAALMFGIWFVGPRLVEEYHYAAEIGKTRAEYEFAVEKLEGEPLSQVSYAYQLVAQRTRPSVVSVNAIKTGREGRGLGSGVIMTETGYIMTNSHVLDGASRFFVELYDKRQYEAQLVGRDEISDLAVLKIDAPKLIPATFGDSDSVEVGSIVWAIGSPYGFEQTVTSGIVSGKDRKGDPGDKYQKQSLIQTDAAVNPGNSGGPLVDAQGKVIGINTSIFGKTFQGISFAVPSETALFVFNQMVKNGKVIRGYLGVVPTEVAHRDLVDFDLENLEGAKLAVVEHNSPAYQAGLRRSDIIKSWNGVVLNDYRNLYRLAEKSAPDSIVEVVFLRRGLEEMTQVRMGQLNQL